MIAIIKQVKSLNGKILFKLQSMSNVRNQNFVFFLYRLLENLILGKNPK